jgi:putative hydrolase of the HAD superfamily
LILVFDLDDTLYPEQTFVLSGFKTVAKIISSICNQSEEKINQELIYEFQTKGRGKVFDNVMSQNRIFSQALLDRCISEYQNHLPDISLFPGALEIIQEAHSFQKYIVTDGNPLTQNNKVDALGIRHHFCEVFPTWSYGLEFAKPSIALFQRIIERENSSFENLIYVGDDPHKDFVSLNKVGAITVRVLTGRFATLSAEIDFDAQITIGDISQFDVSQYLSN